MYNSLTWSIPAYTRNPALSPNGLSAASPLLAAKLVTLYGFLLGL